MPAPSIPTWTPPAPPSEAVIAAQYAACFEACRKGRKGRFDLEDAVTLFSMSTRDGGSVGDETAGEGDIADGRKLASELRADFPALKIQFETVDEWVDVTVRRAPKNPPKPPPYPVEFWEALFHFCQDSLLAGGMLFVDTPVLREADTLTPRFNLPVTEHYSRRDDRGYDVEQYGKAVGILEEALRAPGYQVHRLYGMTVGHSRVGFDFDGKPTWVQR